MSLIGHNNGPTMEPGYSWRKHSWTKARSDLLPKLPIEVIRVRVKRAQELGLDYKSYASVRASTGRDVIGFLFSSNALRLIKSNACLPENRREKLSDLKYCSRIAVVHAPLDAQVIVEQNAVLDAATIAPKFTSGWSDTRASITKAVRLADASSDGIILIGDTDLEREWSKAGRLAGYITADTYFGEHP
ncbi:hypothetical protein [Parasulfitobacter algicola]|uniref:Uncharacterized protein n=1 Tax=Parasulfitobacter algicola TaxID=2614809 RepID=A0ABX2INU2_9RHOB|nr:hypothetical protein [Sulfitobacter algicola]NSX54020.1 hypothetical protein [Sulfitobacter algicola]